MTVIVSPREGHLAAVRSLESVLADDSAPFELIYLDIQPPPSVAAAISATCAARGFPVIIHQSWQAPSAARKAALKRVKTPYVFFVDNDVLVEPGCIGKLLACAEQTGAGIVGPLYLYPGDGGRAIHMAGGVLERDAAGRITRETHHLLGEPASAANSLSACPVDYVEYHCLLARTDLLRRPGVISDDVLAVLEHVDLGLAAREAGAEVWLEPAARVELMIISPPRLLDLAFQQRRWNEADCEADIAAFTRRWPVADVEAFAADNRGFRRQRSDRASPLRTSDADDRERPMAVAELAQTRTALREQALARGYPDATVRQLEAACDVATLLLDGAYRPDGRPFLNHLIGTASALIRYDVRAEAVLAGLLHAAYTHRPAWIDATEISRLIGAGGDIDAMIRALPDAKWRLAEGADVDRLALFEALVLAIEAANEADMRLSGEYRASGRPPEVTPEGLALLADVLARLGAPGLAATASGDPGEGLQGSLFGVGALHQAFRLDARNRKLAPALMRG